MRYSKHRTLTTANAELWLLLSSSLHSSLLQTTLGIYCSAKGIIFMSQKTLLTEHPPNVGPMQHSPAAGKFFLKVTASVLSEGVGMGGRSPWGSTVGFGDCGSGSGVEQRLEAELTSPAPSHKSLCTASTWSTLPALCILQPDKCSDHQLFTRLKCHAESSASCCHCHNLSVYTTLPCILIQT